MTERCACVGVRMGSYANQIILRMPSWSSKSTMGIDRCIADEIQALWRMGIITTGCCCGHNLQTGYIGVEPQYIQMMLQLGYAIAPNSARPTDCDSFYPKSN